MHGGRVSEPHVGPQEGPGFHCTWGRGGVVITLPLSFSQKLKNIKWYHLSLCVLEALRCMKERLHEALVEKNALTSCPVSHSRDSPQGPPCSQLPVCQWRPG